MGIKSLHEPPTFLNHSFLVGEREEGRGKWVVMGESGKGLYIKKGMFTMKAIIGIKSMFKV